MRQIILLLVFSLAVGCNQPSKKKNNESQTQEKVVIPTSLLGKDWEGNEILVGRISYAQMTKYTEAWFDNDYDFYRINEERLEKLNPY